MSEKLKVCPVLDTNNGTIRERCNTCPNRATSQAEVEMREALDQVMRDLNTIFEQRCNAGCDAYANDAIGIIKAILTKYSKGGAT